MMRERAEGISEFLTSDGAHLFKEGEKGRQALQEPRGVMYMRRTMSKDGVPLSLASHAGYRHLGCHESSLYEISKGILHGHCISLYARRQMKAFQRCECRKLCVGSQLEMADQKAEHGVMQSATHSGPTDAQRTSDAHVVLSSMPAARYY